MLDQNSSNSYGSSSEQPHLLFSLSASFENLQISKPLGQKRDEYLQTIRSQKRKHHLHTKRMSAFCFESISNELENIEKIQEEAKFGEDLDIQNSIDEYLKQQYSLDQLDELIHALYSNNRLKQHYGIIGLRKILSNEDSSPIQQVIDAGVIPRLIQFMERDNESHLQTEATWALTNLASGTTEQTKQVVNNGAIPVLVKLLGSNCIDMKEQATWALGNIAGDNSEYRDLVLQAGAFKIFIKILNEAISEESINMIKHGTWALQNLCRGGSSRLFQEIKDAIPVVARIIMTQGDAEILTDAMWALSSLLKGNDNCERIRMIYEAGVLPVLVRLLDKRTLSLCVPCLKVTGKMFSVKQINIVCEFDELIERLFDLLKSNKKIIRKEAAWALSNVTTSVPENLQLILWNIDWLDQIFELSIKDESFEVRGEAVLMLGKMIKSANQRQLQPLLKKGIIEHMGRMIKAELDVRIQEIILKGIVDLLGFGLLNMCEGCSLNSFQRIFEQNDVMEAIDGLKNSENGQIAELAQKIVLELNV